MNNSDHEWAERIRRSYPWASADQMECITLLAELLCGLHHLEGEIKPYADAIKTSLWEGISTFDSDRLTRLVFLAHDRCIRVEIVSSGPRRIGLVLHKRHAREGSTSKRHPTLEQSLELWRRSRPAGQGDLS